MLLVTKCTNCKNEIKIKGSFIDSRIALSRKKGNEFEEKCSKCRTRNQIHVDDIRAEINNKQLMIVTLLCIGLSIFLTIFFWDLGFIATFSFGIPILIYSSLRINESKRIRAFNMQYVDRKRVKEKAAQKAKV